MDSAAKQIGNSSPLSRKLNETCPVPSLTPATDAMDSGFADLRTATQLRTLWPRMQLLAPPRHGRLWFIGGQPGNYKTQLMLNLAFDLASLGQRVLFVSLEQTVGETALQVVARYSRIPTIVMERAQSGAGAPLTEGQQDGLGRAAEKLAQTEAFLRLHGADSHGRSIDDVVRSATRARFDAVFIDHIGMIGRDQGNELEQLSNAIDHLRRLARGQVVKGYFPFVCATTPVKRDSATSDEEKLPAITDFRGSSRLEYDSDVAMILRKRKRADNDDAPDLVDAFVLKNRQGRCPAVLQFEAQGAICTVTERHREDAANPQHWSEKP